MGQFFGSAITRASEKILGVASGLLIFDVFTGLWLSTPTFVQKVMIMSNVLSVYWFISDKYRVSQKLLKMGEHCIVDFQFKHAKTPYKCVHRRQFVFFVF